jgi:RNA polymerase sigma-70 factor (ECF subfamily)
MLGSAQDAEDALQDALLGAWRGLPGLQGRSSIRTWLYRITTNACLALARRCPQRMLSTDRGPASASVHDLGESVLEPVWIESYPDGMLGGAASAAAPEERYEVLESVELAFGAALQHLPPTQRAVVILRDVLAFSAAETATLLDATVPSVNSALMEVDNLIGPCEGRGSRRRSRRGGRRCPAWSCR